MTYDHSYLPLIGRILLATIFVLSGFNKLTDPAGTQEYMAAMGMTWATTLFYLGAVGIELVGGVSLLLGCWTRMGAVVLILFMIPTTLIFHTTFSDPNQMIHFLKNLAMTGGLVYVMAYGPGTLSVDRWLTSSEPVETDHTFRSNEAAAQRRKSA